MQHTSGNADWIVTCASDKDDAGESAHDLARPETGTTQVINPAATAAQEKHNGASALGDISHHSKVSIYSNGSAIEASIPASRVVIHVEQDTYPKSRLLWGVTYMRKWRGGLDTSLSW